MRPLLPLLALVPTASGKQWISEWEQPHHRTLSDQAIREANAGRLAQALDLFKEAYALHPSTELLNNIGVAHEQMRNFGEAHRAYLQALNVDANNANTYRTLLTVRDQLQVNVTRFVATERRKQVGASAGRLPPGDCASSPPSPVPAHSSVHLVNRSRSWSGPTALVVAHWKEDLSWMHAAPFSYMPRVLYQRHLPERPYYSPNYGNEAGIYLQFIVEHYDSLPEQVVFLQGDPASHIDMAYLGETIACLRPGRVRYMSFSNLFLLDRDIDTYTGVHAPDTVAPFIGRTRACARRLLGHFGVAVDEGSHLRVSTYCCAVFTASRAVVVLG